jgi:hypothetical protein
VLGRESDVAGILVYAEEGLKAPQTMRKPLLIEAPVGMGLVQFV